MVTLRSPVRRAVLVLGVVLLATLVAGVFEARANSVIQLYGGENVGTAGAQFLRLPAGARAAALGQAGVAAAVDASGIFWNPASIVRTTGRRNLFFGHTEYAAGIDVEHAAYHTHGHTWSWGVSAGVLRSGDIPRTTEFHQEGTGQSFQANMVVVGLTATRAMTDRFSIGGTLKYYQENLDDLTMSAPVMDVGVLYYPGIGDMRIGFTVRNFGPDMRPDGTPPALEGYETPSEYQSFSAPTSGSFGTAYTWRLGRETGLLTSLEFHHPTDFSESFRFGGELSLGRSLDLRAGWESNRDEGGLSAGFGVDVTRDRWHVGLDYALRDMGSFGAIHMVSVDLAPLLAPRGMR